MEGASTDGTKKVVITCEGLQALIEASGRFRLSSYGTDGPRRRDRLDAVARLDDLPAGWTDRQEAGRYRLERRDDERAVRLCRRPAIVEAIFTSAGDDAVDRAQK